jgi:hypothetical protein
MSFWDPETPKKACQKKYLESTTASKPMVGTPSLPLVKLPLQDMGQFFHSHFMTSTVINAHTKNKWFRIIK